MTDHGAFPVLNVDDASLLCVLSIPVPERLELAFFLSPRRKPRQHYVSRTHVINKTKKAFEKKKKINRRVD